MRKFVVALGAALALAVALPIVTSTANAEDKTVIIKKRDHDRGMHRGSMRGHHYGWDRHHRRGKKVVVIKHKD